MIDLRAKAADLTAQAADLEARAHATEVRAAEAKPVGNYVRTEGGGWLEVQPIFGPRDMQVTAVDGSFWDHVETHPNGDWIYRHRTK